MDAEVEIVGNGLSDGDIIKVQVKAVENIFSYTTATVYVDDRHINYRQRFSAPVIVRCADLTNGKVYRTPINVTEAYQSGGVSRRIDFNLTSDELTAASIPRLLSLVSPPELKELKNDIALIKEFLKDRDAFECGDHTALRNLEDKCEKIYRLITRVDNIGATFPWRLTEMDRNFLTYARKQVFRKQNDCLHQRNNLN